MASWNCQSCEQTNTFKDVTDTLIKLALVGGIIYIAFNFRSEIKSAVQSAVNKKELNGTKLKRKK